MLSIPFKAFIVWKVYTFCCLLLILWICTITYAVIQIKVDMINASVIRGKCGYHLILLFTLILLLNKLFLKGKALFKLLLFMLFGNI